MWKSFKRKLVLYDCGGYGQELAPEARHVRRAEVVRVAAADGRIRERVAVRFRERGADHHEQPLRAVLDAGVQVALEPRRLSTHKIRFCYHQR